MLTDKTTQVTSGHYDIIPSYRRYAIKGTYPRQYYDIEQVERENKKPAFYHIPAYRSLECQHCKRRFRMSEHTYRLNAPIFNCYHCMCAIKVEKILKENIARRSVGVCRYLTEEDRAYAENEMYENLDYCKLSALDALGRL